MSSHGRLATWKSPCAVRSTQWRINKATWLVTTWFAERFSVRSHFQLSFIRNILEVILVVSVNEKPNCFDKSHIPIRTQKNDKTTQYSHPGYPALYLWAETFYSSFTHSPLLVPQIHTETRIHFPWKLNFYFWWCQAMTFLSWKTDPQFQFYLLPQNIQSNNPDSFGIPSSSRPSLTCRQIDQCCSKTVHMVRTWDCRSQYLQLLNQSVMSLYSNVSLFLQVVHFYANEADSLHRRWNIPKKENHSLAARALGKLTRWRCHNTSGIMGRCCNAVHSLACLLVIYQSRRDAGATGSSLQIQRGVIYRVPNPGSGPPLADNLGPFTVLRFSFLTL